MTVTWPKTVAYTLLAVVVVLAGVVVGVGLIALDLSDAAGDLERVAADQQETLDGQDAARERSECLTEEYKEFFAGTAQTLYALALSVVNDTDTMIPDEAIDRLRRAARVLPNIDERCAE